MLSGKLRVRRPSTNDAKLPSQNPLVWLLTSLGAVSTLCVLLGYIAKFGHHALLGIEPGLVGPDEYLASTGEMFRWLIRLPFSDASAWVCALTGWPHLLTLWPALGSLAALWVARRVSRTNTHRHRLHLALGMTVVLLLALRVVCLDAPVALLEDALSPREELRTPDEQVDAFRLQRMEIEERLVYEASKSDKLHRAVIERALVLWKAKRCQAPAVLVAGVKPVKCDPRDYEGIQEGEGLAHALLCGVLLYLAGLLLVQSSKHWHKILASLVILSCMQLAVTFGKLGHSVMYEVVELGMKAPQDFVDTSNDKDALEGSHTLTAIILQTDKDWTMLALPLASTPPRIQLWRVANSNILWERNIYRADVIYWCNAQLSQK
jgi:hypothetical protein